MTWVSLCCAKAYISAVETLRGPDQRQMRFVCTFLYPIYYKVTQAGEFLFFLAFLLHTFAALVVYPLLNCR